MAWVVRRELKTGPRYYVRYLIGGRRYWFSAGKTRAAAERIKAKLETEIAEGRFLDKKRRSAWTLGQLSDVYLSRMDSLRPRSAAWRRDRMRQVLAVLGAHLLIEDVNLGTLDRYVHARLDAGKARSTVNGEVAVLRHAIRSAHRWESETALSEYRLERWRPLRLEEAREPVFLTQPEQKRLLRAARGQGEAELLVRLMLATGARPSELLAIRRGDFDDETLTLRLRTLKHGPERRLRLPGDFRFRWRGDRLFKATERAFLRSAWQRIRKLAKLPTIRLYDLRHTAISEFLRAGLTLREAQFIAGHTTARMTERYAHFAASFRPPMARRVGADTEQLDKAEQRDGRLKPLTGPATRRKERMERPLKFARSRHLA